MRIEQDSGGGSRDEGKVGKTGDFRILTFCQHKHRYIVQWVGPKVTHV